MAEFTLSDGRQITFDLSKLTHRRWTGLFNEKEAEEKSDATVARVIGLTPKEVGDLQETEYREILRELLRRVTNPLTDPNA